MSPGSLLYVTQAQGALKLGRLRAASVACDVELVMDMLTVSL